MANYFEQFHTEAPQALAQPANYFAQFHPADASSAPAPSVAADVLKSGGVGLGEGLISGAGAIGDIRSALSSGVDWLGRQAGISPETLQAGKQAFANLVPIPGAKLVASAPTTEDITKSVQGVTGPFYQPQTVPGEYARTVGQFAPAAIGGTGGIASRVAQVAVPALASETLGQVYKGTEAEPYVRAGGAIAGGLAVPAVAAAARKAVTPFPISQERQAALKTLQAEGVDVPAGMATGSRQLNAAQSQLGGVQYQANLERAKEQYTAAALRRAGIDAPRATPDVLNAADDRIGNMFTSVAARNPVIPVPGFANVANAIAGDFKRLTGAESPLLNELQGRVARTIAGDQYQALQSEMRRFAQASSSPELRQALYDMKTALDAAVQGGLKNPADVKVWKEARRQWAGLKTVEKAVSTTTDDAAAGLITPTKLTQAIQAGSRSKANYARGRGDFADLARAGNQVMKEFPDSGTASRLAAIAKSGAYGALAGAGTLTAGAGLVPAAAALAAPWLAGRALTSRLGQQYLTNQRLGPGPGFRPGAFLPPVFAAPSQLRRPEEQ